jgi:hypothetical protein
MVHTYNPSTQEDLEFEASVGYIVRLSQKQIKKQKESITIVFFPTSKIFGNSLEKEELDYIIYHQKGLPKFEIHST